MAQKLQVGDAVTYRPLYENYRKTSRVASIEAFRPVRVDLTLGPVEHNLVLEDGFVVRAEGVEVPAIGVMLAEPAAPAPDSSIAGFVANHCVADPEAETRAIVLYRAYQQCGGTFRLKTFVHSLAQRFTRYKRGGVVFCRGVRLVQPDDPGSVPEKLSLIHQELRALSRAVRPAV